MKGIYFITGIDTNIGKSYATGWLARELEKKGIRTITQKLIQTGNESFSEDIALHRRIMGKSALLREDVEKLTYPIVYSYPASPHLAAEIDHRETDVNIITAATRILAKRYETVLLEGAGGLMVPLTRNLLTIDYVASQGYPVILVTSGRLGSINHTLLSMEAVSRRGLDLHSVVYNRFPSTDERIEADTVGYLRDYLRTNYPETVWMEMPEISLGE